MENKKWELLRTKLAMFAMATSLSVTSLSGCSSNNILSTEKIEKNIKEEQNFANNSGLYKNQDGTWEIYFEKQGNHYDFKSYEYLDYAIYNSGICEDEVKHFGFNVGYLPFIRCNSNVTYTLNVVNNLDGADIEKLKNDFFQKNSFWANDIKLFYIEDIDGTNQKMIIGYPVSKIEIFNMETWQFENYEGNVILEETCKFVKDYVYLSEVLNYLNEKKKNIEGVSTIETETSSVEDQDNQIRTTSGLNETGPFEEPTQTIEEYNDEENDSYRIRMSYEIINSCDIKIKDNFTSKDLIKVLDFLSRQKNNIKLLMIDVDCNNTEVIAKILKEISTGDSISILELSGFKNLNLADIVKMSNLNWLTLIQCTLEDTSQLNQFTQLERLCLNGTINDLNVISNLTQLRDLTIIHSGEMELANIEILKNFENLNVLRFIDCNIPDISVLSDLNDLEYLILEENPIQNLSELKTMKSSLHVYLDNQEGLSDLKDCIDELNEKGIMVYNWSNDRYDLITKEYFKQNEKLKLKLKE